MSSSTAASLEAACAGLHAPAATPPSALTAAELRRLKKRATNRESARRMRALRKTQWDELMREAAALRAENARLRAMLDCGPGHHHSSRRPPSSRASAARDAAAPPLTPTHAPARPPATAALTPPAVPPMALALDDDDLWLLPAGGGKGGGEPAPVSAAGSDGAPSSARSSDEVAFGGIFGSGLALADLF